MAQPMTHPTRPLVQLAIELQKAVDSYYNGEGEIEQIMADLNRIAPSITALAVGYEGHE